MSVEALREFRLPAALSGLGLAAALMERPTILVPIPTESASRILVGGPCILAGIQVREAIGTIGAVAFNTDTPTQGDSGNVVNAVATATLTGVVGQTTFISGLVVTGAGATGGSVVQVTVGGLAAPVPGFQVVIPAGAGVSITPLVVTFQPPLPASAVGANITVTAPAFGLGNTNAEAFANGFTRLTTAAVAASTATADLLNGQDANGEVVFPMSLGPGGNLQLQMGRDGPFCSRGIFMRIVAGTLRGGLWVKV